MDMFKAREMPKVIEDFALEHGKSKEEVCNSPWSKLLHYKKLPTLLTPSNHYCLKMFRSRTIKTWENLSSSERSKIVEAITLEILSIIALEQEVMQQVGSILNRPNVRGPNPTHNPYVYASKERRPFLGYKWYCFGHSIHIGKKDHLFNDDLTISRGFNIELAHSGHGAKEMFYSPLELYNRVIEVARELNFR